MTSFRLLGLTLVVAGIAAGTILNRAPVRELPLANGYTVLTADFHVHALPGDGGTPAWELAAEARRRGVDVIAVTNHNQIAAARLATGGGADGPARPIVLMGQEVTTPRFHVIAAGIRERIDWNQTAADVIRAIHAQGGVAIAAHPTNGSWEPRDAETLRLLDGIEVAHPLASIFPRQGEELIEFHRSSSAFNPSLAPIGSSDFHFGGTLGRCRTFLFVNAVSRDGVLDAVRAARTVAWDGAARLTGDPSLVAAVQRILASGSSSPANPWSAAASWAVLAGLALIIVFR